MRRAIPGFRFANAAEERPRDLRVPSNGVRYLPGGSDPRGGAWARAVRVWIRGCFPRGAYTYGPDGLPCPR